MPQAVLRIGIVLYVMATSLPPVSSAPADCGSPPGLRPWPDARALSEFNRWMACLGSRLAGTEPHERLLDEIKKALDPSVGPDQLSPDAKSTTFTRWQASSPSLSLPDGSTITGAGYMPYCGLTDEDGVTAELVFEDSGKRVRFENNKHRGKIVVVRIPSTKVPKLALKFIARNRSSDFGHWAPYHRMIALERGAPCLNKAKRAGVKGVVAILDMSDERAAGQYLPFTRPLVEPIGSGVPGIYLDRKQGDRLESLARENSVATLTLRGEVRPGTPSEHLSYTLPGKEDGPYSDQVVLIQTHTDGPGAVEENGVMALIALAHHFAAIPREQRLRTLVFLFATGHFAKHIEGANDVVRNEPPAWLHETRAAIAIEHLGATEWIDDRDGRYSARTNRYGVPRDEPALVFVKPGKHVLEELAVEYIPSARRVLIPARWRVPKIFKRDFFGEGQYIACTGIPTLGYVPNPDYMFSWADPGGSERRGHFEKLDPERMLRELIAFRYITQAMVVEPVVKLPEVKKLDLNAWEEPEGPCD